MSAILTLPISIKAYPSINDRKPKFETIKYAYCLLDLAAEDSSNPTNVFATYKQFISEKISKEIIWQLPCRTNKNGYFIAIDEKLYGDYFYENSAGVKADIDKMPPLAFHPGMQFNLYWTYSYKDFKLARSVNNYVLYKESQLHRCSTMLNLDQSKMFLTFFKQTNFDELSATSQQEYTDKIMELIFRKEREYSRKVVYFGPLTDLKLGNHITHEPDKMTFRFEPHLRLEDETLMHANFLAEDIIKASTATKERQAVDYLAYLEEVLKIVDRRGTEKNMNDIISYHYRCEQIDQSYSRAKFLIEKSFKDISRFIIASAERLCKISEDAILQAAAHYKADEANVAIANIQKARGIYLSEQLWDDMFYSDNSYMERIDVLKNSLDGKPPEGILDKFLSMYLKWDERGLSPSVEIFQKSTEWIEGLLPFLIKNKPQEIASALNRINHFLRILEAPNKLTAISETVSKVFIITDDIQVSFIDARGDPVQFRIRDVIGKASAIAVRLDQLCKALNLIIALKNTVTDPTFKNLVKTTGAAAEAVGAFNKVKVKLMEVFGISETVLTKIAGSAAIIVSFIEATEHLGQGNNMAVLGDMLIGCSGIIKVLCGESGAVGVIIAGVVIAGVIVIYFSLDDDEKFLMHFNEKVWPKAKYAHEYTFLKIFLRSPTEAFRFHDDYIATICGT